MVFRDLHIVDGTAYPKNTPTSLIEALEMARHSRARFRIHYGDLDRGTDWGERREGYVRKSRGSIQTPVILRTVKTHVQFGRSIFSTFNKRGGVILIEYANLARGGIIYKHPNYHYSTLTPHKDRKRRERV